MVIGRTETSFPLHKRMVVIAYFTPRNVSTRNIWTKFQNVCKKNFILGSPEKSFNWSRNAINHVVVKTGGNLSAWTFAVNINDFWYLHLMLRKRINDFDSVSAFSPVTVWELKPVRKLQIPKKKSTIHSVTLTRLIRTFLFERMAMINRRIRLISFKFFEFSLIFGAGIYKALKEFLLTMERRLVEWKMRKVGSWKAQHKSDKHLHKRKTRTEWSFLWFQRWDKGIESLI